MARSFKMVDYEKALDQTVTIRDVLPPDHLAQFIARMVLLLDLGAIYGQYAPVGGEAYAPELLLGLLFYGYATGVSSSRMIEKATYELIRFRFLAGGWYPDQDTIASLRKTFLPEITDLFAQVLVIPHELMVGNTLSNHGSDREEAIPTVDAVPAEVGKPKAGALDNGYWSPTSVEDMDRRGIEPYIATGHDSHCRSWQERFAQQPDPPAEDVSQIVLMAYKPKTVIGKQIYGLRKSTVEPVIGIIKETLGFHQFSLRGLVTAAGEWCLVCLAYSLKRLQILMAA